MRALVFSTWVYRLTRRPLPVYANVVLEADVADPTPISGLRMNRSETIDTGVSGRALAALAEVAEGHVA